LAVHIRLTRATKPGLPRHRHRQPPLTRRPRPGNLGYYNPLTDPVTLKLDDERIVLMSHGAAVGRGPETDEVASG
jgi:hypothetical protein